MKGIVIMRNGIPELVAWEGEIHPDMDGRMTEGIVQEISHLHVRIAQQDMKISFLEKMLGDTLGGFEAQMRGHPAESQEKNGGARSPAEV
jgi:hypothetical protein